MSIEEFLLMEEYNKTLVVYNGIFLTGSEDDKFLFELYSVGEFYVEAKFSISDSRLISFLPFRNPKMLDKYLHSLSITKLLAS